MTENGTIFCMYLWRDQEVGAIFTNSSVTMSIEKAHNITAHYNKGQTCNIALELGWSLKNGPMMSCKACSIG